MLSGERGLHELHDLPQLHEDENERWRAFIRELDETRWMR